MSSTSPKVIKQIEKEITKESKTEEQRLKEAMKELSAIEKRQSKAHKAVQKAENQLAKVNKKESTANAALVKATHKHEITASSVQNAEKDLQDRKDADIKLQQEIDAKKAQVQSAIQSQKNNDVARKSKLRHMKESPGVVGGESAPVPGHSTGFATHDINQGMGSSPTDQPRNLAAEQPASGTPQQMTSASQPMSDTQNIQSGNMDPGSRHMPGVSPATAGAAGLAGAGAGAGMMAGSHHNTNLSQPQHPSQLDASPMQGQGMQGGGIRGPGMQEHDMQGQGLQGSGMHGEGMRGRDMQGQDMYGLGQGMQGRDVQGQGMQGRDMQGQGMQGRDIQGQGMQGRDIYGQDLQGQGRAAPDQNIATKDLNQNFGQGQRHPDQSPDSRPQNLAARDQGQNHPQSQGLRDQSQRPQDQNLFAKDQSQTFGQGQGVGDQSQFPRGQNLASEPMSSHPDQGQGMAGIRDPSNRMQSSPLATNEPLTNRQSTGNPSAYGAGLGQGQGQSQLTDLSARDFPASGNQSDPMRQIEAERPTSGESTQGPASFYGTPPEGPGGTQPGIQGLGGGGNKGANLAGIGAGGMTSANPTSNVPAGGVTHPVTGDTVGAPQGTGSGAGSGMSHLGPHSQAGLGQETRGNIQEPSGQYLNVPGVGKQFVTSDVVDELAGSTVVGRGGL